MTDKASPAYVDSLPYPGEPTFTEWFAAQYPQLWANFRMEYKVTLAIKRQTHREPSHTCPECDGTDNPEERNI